MALNDDVLANLLFKSPKRSFKGARVFDEPKSDDENLIKSETNGGRYRDIDQDVKKLVQTSSRSLVRDNEIPSVDTKSSEEKNRRQIEDNLSAELSYISLSGLQRKIVNFIYNNCRYTRDRKTKPLSVETISTYCNINHSSIKKTIQRLENKGIVTRSYHKKGRGGWTQYELPDAIYFEIVHSENGDELETIRGRDEQKNGDKSRTEIISTSAEKNISGSTETMVLSERGEFVFDFEELSSIGFTRTHLQQILSQNKLSNDVIQQSIFAFAFDLKENGLEKKIKGQPLAYFMGILKKGTPYAPPSNYEDPQERQMRIYLESIEKAAKRRSELEQKVINIKFLEWFATITDEQKKEFSDMKGIWDPESLYCQTLAKSHFQKEVWPTLKGNILDNKIE